MRKLATLFIFGLGFLLGSKAGRAPYDKFKAIVGRIRQTKAVSKPIESTADKISGAVRSKGVELADRAADATYNRITGLGNTPVVIEARIVTEPAI